MKRRTRVLAVIAVFVAAAILLACSLGDAAVTPVPSSGGKATTGEVVFVANLYQLIKDGVEVRSDFTDAMQGYLDRKISLSRLIVVAEKARDWHVAAVDRMERLSASAPAKYKESARLYSDYLRDFADSLDLVVQGLKGDSPDLFGRGIEKLKKASATFDDFYEEMNNALDQR